ncbi:hypothetical protein [Chelatococcus sp. YT9]|uniref:hypothetical protein n=1 Tax=Chelatococcus sp. YT9 TaxID=2835635 RepID=UPI001BCCE51D|nr:hypothetical protein [Chelatococcus sp. YT9]MBS7698613.1 hypothetical protein [Chelatococcus sp. YT9]
MAIAYVEFGQAASSGISSGLHLGLPTSSEKITISASNAVSTGAVANDAKGAGVVRVTVDVDVWIASGLSPDAGAAPRRVLLAGSSIDLLVPAGHKIAVKALD